MTSILSDHLGWYLARLKFIARYTAALLKLATTNLQGLAVALKADAKEASNYRRIRRFLSDCEVDFAALGRLLVRLLPQTPPYRVVLDRTEWHFGRTPGNVLMVGTAHREIAFPISRTVLREGSSSSVEEQCKALGRFWTTYGDFEVYRILSCT